MQVHKLETRQELHECQPDMVCVVACKYQLIRGNPSRVLQMKPEDTHVDYHTTQSRWALVQCLGAPISALRIEDQTTNVPLLYILWATMMQDFPCSRALLCSTTPWCIVIPLPWGGRPSLHCFARQYLSRVCVLICHTHVLALLSHYFQSVTCVYSVIFSLQRWCTGCRVPF